MYKTFAAAVHLDKINLNFNLKNEDTTTKVFNKRKKEADARR